MDPSECRNDDVKELSESECSDSPLCESPCPAPAPAPAPAPVYAKSNAVKEQIRHKNGKVHHNKRGRKPMSK